MTDNERDALAWVGAQSQRLHTWAQAPFLVLGFLGMVPTFLLALALLRPLIGRHAYEASSFAAVGCAVAGVALGGTLGPRIFALCRPRLLRQAAARFGVQEEWLLRSSIF